MGHCRESESLLLLLENFFPVATCLICQTPSNMQGNAQPANEEKKSDQVERMAHCCEHCEFQEEVEINLFRKGYSLHIVSYRL